MMRRRAGFQPDEARRNPCKESENLASSQLLAHDYAARLIDRMHLENVLCQIKTDCRNIAHGWLPLLVIFDDHHYGTRCRERGPSTPSVGGPLAVSLGPRGAWPSPPGSWMLSAISSQADANASSPALTRGSSACSASFRHVAA